MLDASTLPLHLIVFFLLFGQAAHAQSATSICRAIRRGAASRRPGQAGLPRLQLNPQRRSSQRSPRRSFCSLRARACTTTTTTNNNNDNNNNATTTTTNNNHDNNTCIVSTSSNAMIIIIIITILIISIIIIIIRAPVCKGHPHDRRGRSGGACRFLQILCVAGDSPQPSTAGSSS